MERKYLFCNIAWMENYLGVNEYDRPSNGGKYIKEEGIGGEVDNFIDFNGKCYGFVMAGSSMVLEKHYKDVKSTDEFVDDVLVIWVATNEKKQTRIVGWYKNARVYRTCHEINFFTVPGSNPYYNISANSKDCYLLSVDNRTFPIDRASEVGRDMGFGQSNIWYAESGFAQTNIVPNVFQYIDNYKGDYSNVVYDEKIIEDEIAKIEYLNDFDKLYNQGMNMLTEGYHYNALIYFRAAQRINESIEVLKAIGTCLFFMYRCDEIIEVYNKIMSMEGETIGSLLMLANAYDRDGDREKTIEYAQKIIDFPSNTPEDIDNKIFMNSVIFDIYIDEEKFEEAKEAVDYFEIYLENNSDYSKDDIYNTINPMKVFLSKNI